MEYLVGISINVLILSSMYILVALGFAFLFNMIGILNFAHGAIYMIGAYIGYILIVGMGMNSWVALALSILITAAFGVFLEKFCFRPFIGNLNLTIMICVAITLILQTAVNIMTGNKIMAIPRFAHGVLKAGPISVSYERIATFSVGVFVLIVITWLISGTQWGQKMQAISQNKEGASLQGINIHRTSAIACALGCGLAALAGCLMGAYLNFGPFMGDFMLVKVLMLVILAGIGSFGGIFITGLILGCLDGVLPVLMEGALSSAMGVAMVVVLLLIRPKGFFGREAGVTSDDKPSGSVVSKTATKREKWVKLAIYTGLVVFISLLPLLGSSAYTLHIFVLSFIYIIATVSLRTITISGQFPLAHGAFMGIGAYLAGMSSKWFGWSPWFSIPSAALLTAGIGMLIGYPFSRLRAFYYAMGTLFFGIGVVQMIHAGGIWTGSYVGLTSIPPMFGASRVPYYYFFLGLTLISIIALYRFEFCRIGTILKAIAQSFTVASSVGINEGFYRLLAVGVGCFFVGLAGATYAHYNLMVGTPTFNFMATLWLVMYVLIGGIDSFAGPIIGTFVLVLIPEYFRDLKTYSPFISAIILLIVVYLMPQGLVGLPQLIRSWYTARRKGEKIAYSS